MCHHTELCQEIDRPCQAKWAAGFFNRPLAEAVAALPRDGNKTEGKDAWQRLKEEKMAGKEFVEFSFQRDL